MRTKCTPGSTTRRKNVKGLQNDEKVFKLLFRVDPEAVCSLTIGGLQGQFSPPNGRDSQVVCSPYREGPPKRSKRYPNCLPGSAQSRSVHLVQGGFRVNFPRPMKVSRLLPRVGPEAIKYQVSFIKYLVSSIKYQVSSVKCQVSKYQVLTQPLTSPKLVSTPGRGSMV